MIQTIATSEAPAASGHYSQAVVHDGLVYVSGILPVAPVTGEKVLGSMQAQVEQALANLKAILNAAGSDLNHALKVTIFVSDIDDWPLVNQIYARVFGDHRPARTVVPVKELHYGFRIEIDAIAALRNRDEASSLKPES